ncbi:VanZ family protein [Methylomonas sp. BW4-1]|uniref:VanZ family protein n=1 Tax=Methylomonas sp. BW4-1 TaxID=3376685 RepID=UPI0040423D70
MVNSKGNRKVAILFVLLSIVWIGILLMESSQPPAKIMSEIFGLDKVAHFVAFSVLALLICAAAFGFSGKPYIPILSMPLLFTILFGIIEEGYQMTIPGRTASLLDLLIDICGAFFAIAVANRLLLLHKTKSQQ